MRYLYAICFAVFASGAAAQVPFGSDHVIETRFGSLQVVGGEVDNYINFDGLFYNYLYGTQLSIRATAGLADADVDWSLVEGPQNHGQCDRTFRLLALTPRGLSASAPFGPCNGQPMDMQVLPGQVQVTLGGAGVAAQTYTFDGEILHEGTADTAPPPPDLVPVRLAESSNVTTRFGRMWVRPDGAYNEVVVLDGEDLPFGPSERYWIRGHYEGEGRDWVLLSSNHTGNMCGGYSEWHMVQLSDDAVVVGPALDACRGVIEVRPGATDLQMDLGHGDLTVAYETVSWNGETLTSTLVPEPLAEPAGAGADVTRWIGQSAWALFADASERARVQQVMTGDDMQMLAAVMGLSDSGTERDGWVVLTGCQQHACNAARGVLALRIADGAVAAAILTGQPLQARTFGAFDDPTVAAAIADMSQ